MLPLHNRRYQIIVCIMYDVISDIIKNCLLYMPKVKIYNVWSVTKQLWVAEVFFKFYVRGRHNLPEIIDFSLICANLQKCS